MERRTFEDSFKDAFSNAEESPSEQTWTNIELELEREAGDVMRRKLVFYKMLAAASIIFALSVVGIGYYTLDSRNAGGNGSPLAENTPLGENTPSLLPQVQPSDESVNNSASTKRSNQTGNQPQSSESNSSSTRSNPSSGYSEDNAASRQEANADVQSRRHPGAVGDNDDKQIASTPSRSDVSGADGSALSAQLSRLDPTDTYTAIIIIQDGRALPPLYTLQPPTLVFQQIQEDPVAAMLRKLALEEQQLAQGDKKEHKNGGEKVWTSVGFAAGGFSSVNHSITPAASNAGFTTAVTTVPDKQSRASGTTYSMGLNFGTKVAKRWVVQGGVNYLTQSSDYTANNVVADNYSQSLKAESINALSNVPLVADAAAVSNIKRTFPYSVNNSVKFFSVPVQAGYLLVNQKFGLQLNAGLSTDLFLENTITPQSGNLDKTTQGRGEDSPYRSVNFSGLMGTEFSYRFGSHYRVSLNPGLRYPLNSVYKSDIGIQSTPLTFDVGLRFRYIFK